MDATAIKERLHAHGLVEPHEDFLAHLSSVSLKGKKPNFDCVISYSIGQVGAAIRMHDSLIQRGISVLLHVDKFSAPNVFGRAAERIFDAYVVVPLLLRSYEECLVCKHELTFAASLDSKAVVPVEFDDAHEFTWTKNLTNSAERIQVNRRHLGDSSAWEDLMDLLALEVTNALKSVKPVVEEAQTQQLLQQLDSASLNAPYEETTLLFQEQNPGRNFQGSVSTIESYQSDENDDEGEGNPFGAPPGPPPGLSPSVPQYPNIFATYSIGSANSNTSTPLPHLPGFNQPLARALSDYIHDLDNNINDLQQASSSSSPMMMPGFVSPHMQMTGLVGQPESPLFTPGLGSRSSVEYLPNLDFLAQQHNQAAQIQTEQEVMKERIVELEFHLQEQNELRRSIQRLEAKAKEADALKEIVRGLVLEQRRLQEVVRDQERKAAKQTQLMVKIVEFLKAPPPGASKSA
ncbi:hypothetical protein BC830DRAFT_9928 [Chytriomyces sp. MP71]|nr:hypothetical protein BC830DRAFT_9928 [Chytriomyces sp. MP71]